MTINDKLVARALDVYANVRFMDYRLIVRESHGGVHLQAVYSEPDTYTKDPSQQTTRKWLLAPQMTDSELVFTAFKCCSTSFEHRAREAFTYKGARVCGPHFDVEDLVRLCEGGRENAGGR